MNVVDSSGWIEYFADEANGDFFAEPIEQTDQLLVPTLSLYEVYKHVLRESDRAKAVKAVAFMEQARVITLTAPLADSILLATARTYEADFWTQDADFEAIESVRYIRKHQ